MNNDIKNRLERVINLFILNYKFPCTLFFEPYKITYAPSNIDGEPIYLTIDDISENVNECNLSFNFITGIFHNEITQDYLLNDSYNTARKSLSSCSDFREVMLGFLEYIIDNTDSVALPYEKR